MECSVRYAGDAIVVTAQLIDPETNSHLWSDTYPGDLSDLSTVFAMQADIAMKIANAVGAEFSLAPPSSVGSRLIRMIRGCLVVTRISSRQPGAWMRRYGSRGERLSLIQLRQGWGTSWSTLMTSAART